jgi:hypothetical protein
VGRTKISSKIPLSLVHGYLAAGDYSFENQLISIFFLRFEIFSRLAEGGGGGYRIGNFTDLGLGIEFWTGPVR